ncbi:hypothetical protein CC85DRAFT_260464 [Cutaneotrichosporon oleaginosum]|uniref:Secreted protein n=1 Tax=Cutaneotrichosporon oleaginosum TaxID=879819 RepID=A0A0J0XMJ7_9TREE|nr:uncharacterized protein CC85DRAFT_260464 [Cutaneotrichosporon oleaginosum]KLT42380.1 hypothetical protein CC85DRAFT_260464 [Cutaneotrichosporon oleaginosum]TXT04200.1 hypothetical protein COLE_07897 [Cutaneotrichosporon oleaginosum]
MPVLLLALRLCIFPGDVHLAHPCGMAIARPECRSRISRGKFRSSSAIVSKPRCVAGGGGWAKGFCLVVGDSVGVLRRCGRCCVGWVPQEVMMLTDESNGY